MLVREWMTTKVISVTPETSMLKASKLLKDNGIRRLPVLDSKNKVIGIISDRDIKDASPSKATTLDIHELHYLLSEIKVKDIMTKDPITLPPTGTVEQAALLMSEKGFGSLPIVNAEHELIGIVTDRDIFKIYVEVTGTKYGGIQLSLEFKEGTGVVRPLLEVLYEYNASLITLLSIENPHDKTSRRVYVHLQPMECSQENKLIEKIEEKFNLLYWVREKVYEVSK